MKMFLVRFFCWTLGFLAGFFVGENMCNPLIFGANYPGAMICYSFSFFALGFWLLLVSIFSVLVYGNEFSLMMSDIKQYDCQLKEKARRKLAKAVVINFPHNHLRILGMEKLKKYIPPLAAIIFFLNLTGCGDDAETLVALIYIIYFGSWALLVLASVLILFFVIYLITKVLRWYRRIKV